jgi:hypothetical protein
MTVKLGTAKYERQSKNYFSFKRDQNQFILRIIPPYGKLAEKGKFSVYHRVEFGYKGTDGRMKPFLSPRVVNREKMVEQESLAHVRREQIKSQQAQAKAEGNEAMANKCGELLRQYNQDAKHYMNTIDLNGNIGLFKIGHKGYTALQAKIKAIKEKDGIDPLGIETGRYFIFSRTGQGRDTLYTVEEYKKKQELSDGQGGTIVADVSFNHVIDDNIINRLEAEAFELLDVYPSVSLEEEKMIVEGGPAGVDAVFNARKATSQAQSQQTSTPAPQPEAQPQPEKVDLPVAKAEEPVAQTTVQTEDVATTVNTNTGEVLSETPAASATPAAPATDVASMSDEDFFAAMENGKLG